MEMSGMMSVVDRNNVVEQNMPLVTARVKKLNNGMYDEDMFQEGCMGLIYAADRFDPSKGSVFSTYAVKYIDGYIKAYKNKNSVIRPRRKGSSFERASVESLNSRISNDDDRTLEDVLCDEENPIQGIIDDIAVDMFFDTLNHQERSIVELMTNDYTQREISRVLGISQPQVSRVLKEVRAKYIAV
jgi:RNA polymerase sporulation-specific sigma factor